MRVCMSSPVSAARSGTMWHHIDRDATDLENLREVDLPVQLARIFAAQMFSVGVQEAAILEFSTKLGSMYGISSYPQAMLGQVCCICVYVCVSSVSVGLKEEEEISPACGGNRQTLPAQFGRGVRVHAYGWLAMVPSL